MRLRSLLIAAVLPMPALPLPAQAQSMPPHCTVTRQCMGGECTDSPGTALMFQDTDTGLVTWDTEVPQERIALTALPGDGPATWTGHAPALGAMVMMSRLSAGQAVISMHMDHPSMPSFVGYLTCVQIQPPAPVPTKAARGRHPIGTSE